MNLPTENTPAQPIFRTISVVIPHFNSPETLKRAIKSVLSQTYPVLEIIVVDDCSDKIHETELKSLLTLDQKIQLVQLKENQGPATARNTGWDQAQGEWIAFLDSDDSWHSQKLEIQMNAIASSAHPVSLIGCETEVLSTGKKNEEENEYFKHQVSRISKWELTLRNRFPTSTVVLRTGLPYRFSEGRRYAEDYELWLEISGAELALLKVHYPLVYLYKARYGASGLSGNLTKMAVGELVTFWRVFRKGTLSLPYLIFALTISLFKTGRRFLLTRTRSFAKN